MKVKKVTLLLIACIVWMAAGFNIFRIGLIEYPPYLSIFNLCLSIIVFTVFQYFIFGKLVKRHTKRILNYKKDYQFFLKFFDYFINILYASGYLCGVKNSRSTLWKRRMCGNGRTYLRQ